MLGDLFHRLGTAIGELEARIQGNGGGREVAVYDPETGDVHDLGDDATDTAANAALVALAGWLVSRLLRPRPVSWPRVVTAGVAAGVLAEVVGRAVEESPEPGREPHAEGAEELLARLSAGVAVAAGYAALLYPRLPGPPLARGLAFGALEVLAAPRGGLVRLATDAPGVKFPLQALALPVDEDAGPLSHLAFGLGLGLFYRYDPDADDESDDD